ncbi:hypothetical protein CCP3SC15_1610003 [Gammaproteobacteria bacterium]
MDIPHIAYKRDDRGGGKLFSFALLTAVSMICLSYSLIASIRKTAQPLEIVIPGAIGISFGLVAILIFVSWYLYMKEDLFRQHTQNLPSIVATGQHIEKLRLITNMPQENLALAMQDKPTVIWSDDRNQQLVEWLEVSPKMRIPWDWVINEYMARITDDDRLPPTSFWSEGNRHPDTGIEYRVYSEEMKTYLQKRHLATWAPWNQPVPIIDKTALFGYFGIVEDGE